MGIPRSLLLLLRQRTFLLLLTADNGPAAGDGGSRATARNIAEGTPTLIGDDTVEWTQTSDLREEERVAAERWEEERNEEEASPNSTSTGGSNSTSSSGRVTVVSNCQWSILV